MSTVLNSAELAPPVAKADPFKLEKHGDMRVDPYYWLREKKSPDVLRYLEEENRYTEAVMKPTEGLQKKLYDEILGRIKETDQTAPVRRGPWLYYSRTEKGKDYQIYCRRLAAGGNEQVLLDGNELAKGKKYFRVGVFQPSPDHQLLAYSTDDQGDEEYTLVIKDLGTGKLFSDAVHQTYYDVEWANDNKTLFYTKLDSAKRPYRVYRHVLGAADDKLIYEEKDERFHVGLEKTLSHKFLIIQLHSSLTTEALVLPADKPNDEFKVLLPREQEVEYDVAERNGEFWIRTNDHAKNFRLIRTPVNSPDKKNWVEILPNRDNVKIDGIELFANHLLVVERENGLTRLRVRDLRANQDHYVDFPEPAYMVAAGGNYEFTSPLLRFQYTSLLTPMSSYDYDMNKHSRELIKREEVPGDFDPARYSSERVFATAKDGTKIPVALVYRKGFVRDGKAPTLLYGYGSYGSNSDATFSAARLSLLDRGFVYAIANIRGGAEMGELWHDNGKLMNKRNTFTDFISAAEYLVEQKITSPDHLAMMGGSAGGLLMGAVVNLRPDLFKAVIAKVPFVDVVTTILDPSLPLSVIEYEEWGNPNEQKAYDYMKSYSPYDNVKAQAYPNMLVTAGLNDPRVSYWEPAKWVAKLRKTKTDRNVLLLKTEMGSGHFGKSGRYDKIKETAFDYAFLISMLGVN